MLTSEIEEILASGVALEQDNISGYGLNADQLPLIVAKLLLEDVAVFGGDVVEERTGRYVYTRDNWYIEKETGEPWHLFVKRSGECAIREAKKYSLIYEEPVFVLVVACENDIKKGGALK